MPGRGTPWRKGKGKKGRIAEHDIEDDSIESIDIKDLTIAEVDLSPAVTTKLNKTGGHILQDEGTPLTQQGNMNFVGTGVTASVGGEDTTIVTIPGGVADGVGYDEIQDEGTPLAKEPAINFVGAGVTATTGTGKTIVTIPGGGAGVFDPYTTEPNDYTYFYDEFYYPNFDPTIANAHWERIGSLGFTTPASVVGGAVDQSTNAIANTVVGLRTCAGGLVAVDITKKFKVVWAIELISGIVNTAQRIGLFAEAQSPSGTFPYAQEPNPHLWFAHDGSGNWLAETDNGVTPVSTDTGVAVATGKKIFEISFDPAGTPTVTFKINGTIVATSTVNIPTGNLSVGAVIQTGTTATRTHRIDTALIVNDR